MGMAGKGAVQTRRPHVDRRPASHNKAYPACLAIDQFVEGISTTLMRAGAGKVEALLPEGPVRLAINEEEMDEAFATLGSTITRGAAVTIIGELVRIETGETEKGKGCALLSVSVTGGQAAAKTMVRDALSVVRATIKKQSGFLRFWEGRNEMRLSLYLPVKHNP